MKKLLVVILGLLLTTACKKNVIIPPVQSQIKDTIKLDTTKPTKPKVGFVIDTNWFASKYPGFWIETHNGNGSGDFNKDGLKDLVVMFATNSPAKHLFQTNEMSRIVVGVFINNKTYFELDTNLVYSYLGGFAGVNVSDINKDGYLDLYQMTGYWEGADYPKPKYYNNSGWGGMDSYVFINDKNKSLKKYTLTNQNDAGSTTSIIIDNNKNGFEEIYLSSCLCYYEFDGNNFNRNQLTLDNKFKGQSYNLNVITPKFASEKSGVIYGAENVYGESYFLLKLINNKITPIINYKPAYPNSGCAQEINVEDLDKDSKLEYIIPMEISSNSSNSTPAIPYLMIVDESGNDVSKKYMDDEITKPLTFEQMNWVGETWQTGFIYHTFADIDNDNVGEIFPASGVGYKKGNDTYYYKFKDGKYKLELYHNNWMGDVHKSKGYINYKPFVDEKNKVNVFLPVEGNLLKAVFKTF